MLKLIKSKTFLVYRLSKNVISALLLLDAPEACLPSVKCFQYGSFIKGMFLYIEITAHGQAHTRTHTHTHTHTYTHCVFIKFYIRKSAKKRLGRIVGKFPQRRNLTYKECHENMLLLKNLVESSYGLYYNTSLQHLAEINTIHKLYILSIDSLHVVSFR
jgi:hypothetical protein